MLSLQYFTKISKLPIMQGNFMRIFNWLQLMSLKVFPINLPNVIANRAEMAQDSARICPGEESKLRICAGLSFTDRKH